MLLEYPRDDAKALAARTSALTGRPLRPEAFRKQVSRARFMLAKLLVREVIQTLDRPTRSCFRADPGKINTGARHPRGNTAWPKVGIFAQRGKDRPNRIGVTVCKILSVDGLSLRVRGLDAIDGTPVLDIKPVMKGFLPRGEIREPDWARKLMADYWTRGS